MIPIDELAGKTIFITGSGKNTGKTTILMHLIRLLRGESPLCYLSAGLDGEAVCAVTGEEKAGVYCRAGDLLATSGKAIQQSRAEFEILEVFPWATALGRTVLARVVSGGKVELIGPETNSQLGDIIKMVKSLGDEISVFVDGAAGRVTQISSALSGGFVHVLKLDPLNFKKELERIRLLGRLDSLEVWKKEKKDEKKVLSIEGAITGSTSFPEAAASIIIEDPGKIFLTCHDFVKLQQKHRFFVKNQFPLKFCLVRVMDMDRKTALSELKKAAPEIRFVENPFEEAVGA